MTTPNAGKTIAQVFEEFLADQKSRSPVCVPIFKTLTHCQLRCL